MTNVKSRSDSELTIDTTYPIYIDVYWDILLEKIDCFATGICTAQNGKGTFEISCISSNLFKTHIAGVNTQVPLWMQNCILTIPNSHGLALLDDSGEGCKILVATKLWFWYFKLCAKVLAATQQNVWS